MSQHNKWYTLDYNLPEIGKYPKNKEVMEKQRVPGRNLHQIESLTKKCCANSL